jgi:hypothetical protein
MSHHPVRRLTAPDGSRASIDVQLAPLIKALWAAGYETIGSCQDLGESLAGYERKSAYWKGYVLLEMPVGDACRLIDAVRHTPQFKDRMHWASDGAWETSVPVIPFADAQETWVLPWAQVHFPASQIGDLTDVIREAG